ncbi:MAG: hypothetical protein GY679_03730 [Mycoplasma sp.]|nr:hypothetical protein [Mycoplasma sp.]
MKNIKEKYKLLNQFSIKAKKSNSWYALTGKTLLTALRTKDIVDLDGPVEVMMTIESYNNFKSKNSHFLSDRTLNNNHLEIRPHYFLNTEHHGEYIRINIVVPTLINKLKKFNGWKSRKNYYLFKLFNDDKYEKTFMEKILYISMFPFKNKIKYKSHITVYNQLFIKKNEGFFEITKPTNPVNKNWIPQLTFKTLSIEVNYIPVKIPYEYKTILNIWFNYK